MVEAGHIIVTRSSQVEGAWLGSVLALHSPLRLNPGPTQKHN